MNSEVSNNVATEELGIRSFEIYLNGVLVSASKTPMPAIQVSFSEPQPA